MIKKKITLLYTIKKKKKKKSGVDPSLFNWDGGVILYKKTLHLIFFFYIQYYSNCRRNCTHTQLYN